MGKLTGDGTRTPAFPEASFKAPLGASRLSPLSRERQPPAPGLDRFPTDDQAARGPRRLLIIARDRLAFYEAARREFADHPDIEVILDRREPGPRALERRGVERRKRADVDEVIRKTGWAVVHLDE